MKSDDVRLYRAAGVIVPNLKLLFVYNHDGEAITHTINKI